MAAHPDIPAEILALDVLGELPAQDAADVRAALAASPKLRLRRQRIADALAGIQDARLAEPPTQLVQHALRLVSAPPAQAHRPGLLAAARMIFDSLAGPALGFRGGAVADLRRLAFDSELGQLDLEIREPAPGRETFRITGQLMTDEPAPGAHLSFVDTLSGQAGQAAIDDRGLFTIELAAGEWDLTISLGDRRMTIPRLTLG